MSWKWCCHKRVFPDVLPWTHSRIPCYYYNGLEWCKCCPALLPERSHIALKCLAADPRQVWSPWMHLNWAHLMWLNLVSVHRCLWGSEECNDGFSGGNYLPWNCCQGNSNGYQLCQCINLSWCVWCAVGWQFWKCPAVKCQCLECQSLE